MVVKDPFPKIFQALIKNPNTTFAVDKNEISISLFDKDQKFFLSSPVYSGGNYIPSGVRSAINKAGNTNLAGLKVYFTIKEEEFLISANSLNKLEGMGDVEFMDTVFEFSSIVEKWKDILDERDRNDLIHVKTK